MVPCTIVTWPVCVVLNLDEHNDVEYIGSEPHSFCWCFVLNVGLIKLLSRLSRWWKVVSLSLRIYMFFCVHCRKESDILLCFESGSHGALTQLSTGADHDEAWTRPSVCAKR